MNAEASDQVGESGADRSAHPVRRAPEPARRPTMVDVARHAGVSIKTVSRVINNEPNVQQQLIDRVLASVAELGFRRNHLARTLRSGQSTATIGLII